MPKSRGSDPVAFYRVQVGVLSPEGLTTTRGILRRFSDFLNLFYELKKAFPLKTLPPAPPKTILRMKSRTSVEEYFAAKMFSGGLDGKTIIGH